MVHKKSLLDARGAERGSVAQAARISQRSGKITKISGKKSRFFSEGRGPSRSN